MSCVLDNSVAMRWFFKSDKSSDNTYSLTVRQEIYDGLPTFAPPIFLYEAGNIFLRMSQTREDTIQSLQALHAFIQEFAYEEALAFESANIANDLNLTTYDASYLALAILTKSSIATLDKDMVKAARKLEIPRTCSSQ